MQLTPRTFHRAGGFASWLHLGCCCCPRDTVTVTFSNMTPMCTGCRGLGVGSTSSIANPVNLLSGPYTLTLDVGLPSHTYRLDGVNVVSGDVYAAPDNGCAGTPTSQIVTGTLFARLSSDCTTVELVRTSGDPTSFVWTGTAGNGDTVSNQLECAVAYAALSENGTATVEW